MSQSHDQPRKITCTCCRKVSHLHAFCHSTRRMECTECGVEFDVSLLDYDLAELLRMSLGNLRSRVINRGIPHRKWGNSMILNTRDITPSMINI